MKRILLLTTISLLVNLVVNAQNVFNPNDPLVRYNANASVGTAQKPDPNINGLQKWVADSMSSISNSYSTQSYKAYYMNINGVQMPFRLKYPKSYNNPDSAGKKYPVMMFFHGTGEAACNTNGGVYNNEKQLLHGGRLFRDHVDNDRFDGFLLYPQVVNFSTNCSGNWGVAPASGYYAGLIRLVDSLGKYVRADVDRLIVTGLSNGGGAAWSMAAAFPARVAAVAPSAAATGQTNYSDYVHVPVYFASGGTDNNPTPAFSESVYNALKNLGADIKYILYPTLGHSMWNNHWNEPDFVPFMNRGHKANPLVFFQRDEWCPEDVISAKLGITAGFAAYEWEKDGVVIARRQSGSNTILDGSSIVSFGAGGNEITVKSYGVYKVRFRRTATSDWSAWSPRPAVIRQKAVTQTPNIQVQGVQSHVLPGIDGKNSVTLTLPEGFYAYEWYNAENNQLIGSGRTYNASVGKYKARVVEQYGCGTLFSPVFEVVSASGAIKPDPAKTLVAMASSLTSVQLDWNENPNAGENETGFEIYRATNAGGPYSLIHITAPDVVSYLDAGLTTNTQYYYVVRAVGRSGAAANSNEASVITAADVTPPTAPTNLRLVSSGKNFATIAWNASTDDAGVDRYDIFINNQKSFTTTATNFSIPDLEEESLYTIVVKARDKAGNISNPSNQVTASTSYDQNGLNYKYYEGSWSNLPDFSLLTPLKTGIAPTPDIAARLVENNYAFLWEGLLKVDVAANYTFEICSDDGSRLWIGSGYTHGTSTINNDGAHGNQCRTATVQLAVGLHPIAAGYFQATGGQSFSLSWQNNAGLSKQTIPQSNLLAIGVNPSLLPAAPTALQATKVDYKTVELTWENSGSATGYEVVRSTTENGVYEQVASVNGFSYSDSTLTPNTTYFYKVRSIGLSGESAYTSAYTGIYYSLDSTLVNAWNTTGGTNTNLTQNGTLTQYWNKTDKKYGTFGVQMNGTSHYFTINGSSANQYPNIGGYSQRTVAMWIKPTTIANRKVLFDIGNSTNGIALRFNNTNNALEAGIASAGVRFTAAANNFQTGGHWIANGWNHVAVVYNTSSLQIFLNGVLVASNNNLSFVRIAANAGNNSRFGYSGTAAGDNAFNQASASTDFYAGLMDEIYILNGALSASEIVKVMNNEFVPSNTKTDVAPAPPAAPANLTATVVNSNSIQLAWNDNSTNETGFEIWRSVSNNQTFRLVHTVPANASGNVTFTDTELFANSRYYYKILAKGDIQNSGFSNEADATTPNTKPVISKIEDATVKYGNSHNIKVEATDPDGDVLTFSAINLPYFVTIEPVSNGVANLVVNAEIWDIGYYESYVIVSDALGAKDTTYFTLVINDNNVPVFNQVTTTNMTEGQLLNIPIQVVDEENTGLLIIRPVKLPTWATLTTDSTNGSGNIQLVPGFDAAGSHQIKLSVEDEYGAINYLDFMVNVTDVDPNESYKLNFVAWGPQESGWNTVNVSNNTINQSNLRNHKNEVTNVRVQLTKGTISSGGSGMNTGSGVYPANVRYDMINWGYFNGGSNSADTIEVTISGLSAGKKYNLIFYAGTNCNYCSLNNNSVTTFKAGDQIAQVRMFNNLNMTDTLVKVTPNASGSIVVTMIGDANTAVGGNLNAMVIESNQDDGTTPLKPLNLTATQRDKGVRLTWVDQAYNEDAYNVYRATAKTGPYTLLNPGASNRDSTGYNDENLAPFTNYYYYVKGMNNHGLGISSDTVLVQTLNNNPTVTSVAGFSVKAESSATANFTVGDDPGDVITVSLQDAPAFITLTKLSATSYRINANPTASNVGKHTFEVVVLDDKGGRTTTMVTVSVADKNTRSVYVNFAPTGYAAPAPWNNLLGYGGQGNTLSNLLDENGANTSYSVTLVNKWAGLVMNGQITGDNSGTYPDAVLNYGWWDNDEAARQIRFNNLNNNKVYNIVIMASRSDGVRSAMRFSVGSVADTLDGSYNSYYTANLNRLVPTGGAITIDILKLYGAPYTVINAIQIEELDNAITLAPNNLHVEAVGRDAANITWSDRNHNETAFQLQVASDANFSTILTSQTLPANTVSYKATGLPINKRVWARVRTVVGGENSEWSNVAFANTSLSQVFVNFNIAELNVASPWNNLESNPTEAFTKSGLVNQSGLPSGVSVEFLTPMNGDNNFGMSTGNNSGVVPDNALRSNYWIDKNQKSQVKLTGLNQAKKYRIGFFGSMSTDGWFSGNYTGTYTVNGVTVLLNSWLNDRKVVFIENILPNSDGEVLMEFSTIDEAQWAFNGGLIIESYDIIGVSENPDQGPLRIATVVEPELKASVVEVKELAEIQIGNAEIYPNPFKDQLNIQFTSLKANQNVVVNVYNMNGSLVHTQQMNNRPAGKQLITLNLGNSRLVQGYYLVTVVVNGKVESTKKVMKSN
ncbi:fibronectin type III domain-containing protein [Gynurincola endophyticus]|uniref:fibronectin type III domain-containing protein n=1 Tax=Gynurincola endophyticus TaxID=2479004 RepID=UPI000F8D092A|nr:LamG-like jellyroll fold domain-containing protein [Gynurincola endophyticus]